MPLPLRTPCEELPLERTADEEEELLVDELPPERTAVPEERLEEDELPEDLLEETEVDLFEEEELPERLCAPMSTGNAVIATAVRATAAI